MRTLLLYIPVAGGGQGRDLPATWAARLGAEWHTCESAAEATARAAEAEGYDRVVAAGGDGTVHEVANGLMRLPEPRPRLGLLPLGTGNDIARNLGVVTPEQSLDAIESGAARRIDLMRVEHRVDGQTQVTYAVLNCAVGLSAAVVRLTTPRVKRWFGPAWAYTVGTLRAVAGWRSPVFHLVHDGGEIHERCMYLGIGNGEVEAAGTMRISPGATMDDGLLNVLFVHHGPRTQLLRNLSRVATGEHIHHPLVEYFTTTRLTVESEPAVEWQADGDVRGLTPLSVEVVPAALEVAAP